MAIDAGSNAIRVSPGKADSRPFARLPFSAGPARTKPTSQIAPSRNSMKPASSFVAERSVDRTAAPS